MSRKYYEKLLAVNIEDIYIPRNNPTYPPMLPINACMSTSFDWVMILAYSGYEIDIE